MSNREMAGFDSGEMICMLMRAEILRLGGHFDLPYGKHARDFLNKQRLFSNTTVMTLLAFVMARLFQNSRVQAVVGAETGGAQFARYVAAVLTLLGEEQEEVLHVSAPKQYGQTSRPAKGPHRVSTKYVIVDRKGFLSGKRVLVVEDVIDSGEAVRSVVEALRALKCEVVGITALINRAPVTAQDAGGVPVLHALLNVTLPSWSKEECKKRGPCSQGVALVSHTREVGAGAR